MLSVIVPAYNAARTLPKLLDSFLASEGLSDLGEYELLVVDDASSDGTARVAEAYAERFILEAERRGRFLGASPLRVIRQSPNQGPARARNLGVENARGDLLLFLDADVALRPDTLRRMLDLAASRPEMAAFRAIYSPVSLTPGRWARYKAAHNYAYSVSEGMRPYTTTIFGTSCGLVRREVFDRLKGFNEAYRKADIEDYEFGRVLMRYGLPTLADPTIQVDHHFPTWGRNVRIYFRRARLWMRLFFKDGNFDDPHTGTSAAEGFGAGFAVLAALMLVLRGPWPAKIALAAVCFGAFALCNRRFFQRCFRDDGFRWAGYCVTMHYVMSFVIAAGVGQALGAYLWDQVRPLGAEGVQGAR